MAAYDFLVGVGHIAVVQPPPEDRQPEHEQVAARSSYLKNQVVDPDDPIMADR